MSSAHDLVANPAEPAATRSNRLANWYTQGTSDGLGDRLLVFDNASTPSLELLRFRPELANAPGFERALRVSVERLLSFIHPAFAPVRAVEFLDGDEGLALVSTHVPGKRLAAMFQGRQSRNGMHPAFVTWLIRQLTLPVFELHSQGRGIAHGALTADRIVLTSEGHVVIVEHVLGSALAQLRLSAKQLWDDLGIVAVTALDGVPCLDGRADVRQVGLVALSVLLGRRVTPEDYPANLARLLDEFAESAVKRSPLVMPPLRLWLERALCLDGRGFESAEDACVGLEELPGPPGRQAFEHLQSARPRAIVPAPRSPMPEAHMKDVANGRALESAPIVSAIDDQGGQVLLSYRAENDNEGGAKEEEEENWVSPQNFAEPAGTRHVPRSKLLAASRELFSVRNLALGLAVVQALAIGWLLTRKPPAPVPAASVPVTIESPEAGDTVVVDGQPIGVTPLRINVGSSVHSIRVVSRDQLPAAEPPIARPSPPPPEAADTRITNAIALAAARQRSGGVRFTSPIELQVLEGERVLGSSADGPIVTTAGVHQLDLINPALGYRSRQAVDIKAGQIVAVTVRPPDGKLSINALPWAQVWIDGTLIGETPLANVSVPVGEHEIIFRHPQLGERREKTIVKSGAVSRLSATLSP